MKNYLIHYIYYGQNISCTIIIEFEFLVCG